MILFFAILFVAILILTLLTIYILRIKKENKVLRQELFHEVKKNREIERFITVIDRPIIIDGARYFKIKTSNAFFLGNTLYPTTSIYPVIIIRDTRSNEVKIFFYDKRDDKKW